MIAMTVVRIPQHNFTGCWSLAWTGIRKATTWYNGHIARTRLPIRGQEKRLLPPCVILMTEDTANRRKAEKEGIICVSGSYSVVVSNILTLLM